MILAEALKNPNVTALSMKAKYSIAVPVSIYDDKMSNSMSKLKSDWIKWNIDKDFIYAVVSGIL